MAKQSMQDIKRRIKSVSSTERITNSMKLISAGKLRKARKLFEETHENSLFITNAINELFQSSIDIPTKYLENDRKQDRTVYIVVTSSKGLCGGEYNAIVRVLENGPAHPGHRRQGTGVLREARIRDLQFLSVSAGDHLLSGNGGTDGTDHRDVRRGQDQ